MPAVPGYEQRLKLNLKLLPAVCYTRQVFLCKTIDIVNGYH